MTYKKKAKKKSGSRFGECVKRDYEKVSFTHSAIKKECALLICARSVHVQRLVCCVLSAK